MLEHHAGYLTSCPDLAATLTPLLSLMTARTALFPKLSQLRGRLHLMLGELEHRSAAKSSSAELPATALLVYREGNSELILVKDLMRKMLLSLTESSDEASEEGDWPLQSGSESEDQWDELSDYGMDVNETKDDEEDSEVEEEDDDDEEGGEDDDDDKLEADEGSSIDEDDDEEVMENGLSD